MPTRQKKRVMTETTDPIKFAEMLCTRFCHDIIGPVGAVSNGAEFLRDEMPELQSQAMDLIEKSSREAIARVQFYRQAYGAGLRSSSASLTEAQKTARNFFEGGKITLDWDDKYTDMSGVDINYTHKKIILNLLVIAASALIRGGKLIFTIDNEKISVRAEGSSVKLDAEMENCLKTDCRNSLNDPKLVQAKYTAILAEEGGMAIGLVKTNESLAFTLTKK
jgi:histidine phosphotransferase ChpT